MTEVGGGRFGPEGDSLSPVAYVIGGVAQTFREFLPSRGNAGRPPRKHPPARTESRHLEERDEKGGRSEDHPPGLQQPL